MLLLLHFTCQTRINFLRRKWFFAITSTLGSVPAQLYHQTPGRHQAPGNVNGLRTAYLKGHLFSGQSHQRCDHQVLLLKHPHSKKGGAVPSTNFSPIVSIHLGANNLPDWSLNLLFRKRSLRFVFYQPNTAGDMYPGPNSSALLPYGGRVGRFFCFALFGRVFKQKVYRHTQWWKDITTNINTV